MDIYFKSYRIVNDPDLGWNWYRVNGELEPDIEGEGNWGLSKTLYDALEDIDACLSPEEAKRWDRHASPLYPSAGREGEGEN